MICLKAFDSAMISDRKIARIETVIHLIRRKRVMLDSDLAAIYGVSTRQLNQQLKRNRHRFPEDFAFQLDRKEFKNLMSQIVISKKGSGGRRKLPWVFTEHGSIMLASILSSDIAVQASVRVVRAFVRLHEMVAANTHFAAKLEELDRRLDSHDEAIANVFAGLKKLVGPPEPPKKREIGFHVRQSAARYRVRRKSMMQNRNLRIS